MKAIILFQTGHLDICYALFHKFRPVGLQELPGEFEAFWVFADSDDQWRQVLSFHDLSLNAFFQKPRQNEKEKHIIEQV